MNKVASRVPAGPDDLQEVFAVIDPAGVGGRAGVAQKQGAGVAVGERLLLGDVGGYAPDHPEHFDSLARAREWLDSFTSYHGHRHSVIGLHTSASVHFGTAEEVRDQRSAALAEAHRRHPERFARRPRPPAIPGQVWINSPAKRGEPEPQGSWHYNRLVQLDGYRKQALGEP